MGLEWELHRSLRVPVLRQLVGEGPDGRGMWVEADVPGDIVVYAGLPIGLMVFRAQS